MGIEFTNNVTAAAPGGTDRAAERAEVKRLAQEFEAMLMTQMLRDMRRAMLDDGDQEDGFGAEALTDTGDIELSHALSAGGGIGLTRALLEAFERQIPTGDADSGTGGPAFRPARASASEGAALRTEGASLGTDAPPLEGIQLSDITSPAPVSSRFGWRRDPFTGEARFHKGIDIAVAYGQDVKAAAAGRVAFAGVQNGYGQTVVIDHADGRQTRYAHLSETLVRAGDPVAEGQVVARSGNSGRSTGAHLHFEVLVDGRPVDPAAPAVQTRAD